MTESEIQYDLHCYLIGKGHVATIPNVSWSWLYWEADLISITKAHLMYEYEIKISLSDFKKDFLKRKHLTLGHKRSWESRRVPNYFVYVAPARAVPICIPDHAGLYLYNSKATAASEVFTEVKKPSRIHNLKQDDRSVNKMLRTLMYKYWDMAGRNKTLKRRLKKR